MMLGTLGAVAKYRGSAAADAAASKPDHDTSATARSRVDHIAMLVYPQMTALELIARCSAITRAYDM
jgi:hypothetical protein